MYKYIYGPVPSRRLGISLGIDLVPYKTCTLNCIYCECGGTTDFTLERREYIPAGEIIGEVRNFLANNPPPDWITLSGSGEPTLNSKTGYIIKTIKREFPHIRFAVITNGTLLYQKEVREELMNADLVLPSLDAVTETAFCKIDVPIKGLDLSTVIDGIAEFTREFQSKGKEIWLEVFIMEGINDDSENIKKLKETIRYINPSRVQLNSLDRPGTVSNLKPASKETLLRIKKELGFPNTEIISKYKKRSEIQSYHKDKETAITEVLRVRPCTTKDISEITGIPINEINQYIDILLSEKKIEIIRSSPKLRGVFFRYKSN
jgi:wyosine [tRNA(Phe)-imidazoG37] synthetase (radical SAM superfamily)